MSALKALPVIGELTPKCGRHSESRSVTVLIEDWMQGYCGGRSPSFWEDGRLVIGTDLIPHSELDALADGTHQLTWDDGCRRRCFVQVAVK